jgi:hypothetical protein
MGWLHAKSVLKVLLPTVCSMGPLLLLLLLSAGSSPSSLKRMPGVDAQTRATKRESESLG